MNDICPNPKCLHPWHGFPCITIVHGPTGLDKCGCPTSWKDTTDD